MKPLARWTIGRVSERGWTILTESVRLFPKVYPEFDLVICHNNLSLEEKIRLASFNIPLYAQYENQAEFPFKENKKSSEAKNFAWKLIPTRLRPEAHELWIDNDIIIRQRIPQIDQWLAANDTGIISRGANQDDYGRFSGMISEACCAGLFGLPPLFDFKSEILKYCDGPLYGFDEQGLVSMVVCSMNHIVIPSTELGMAGMWCTALAWRTRRMPPNVHFARANTQEKHPAWGYYKVITMP